MRISAGSLLDLALRGVTSLHGGKAWAALLFVLAAGELPGATLPFRRGDSNDDGKLNLGDAVFTLEYLFQGGKEPTCQDAADSNDDGFLNLSDPVHLLSFLFLGRPPPPPPGLDCGEDTTGDDLTCFCFHSCQGPPEPPPGGGDQGKYLATGEMNQPRYLHEAILTKSGLAAVFGGSDEHGFSGIDTAELYDPVSGLWIDTDFQGNRIRSGIGPRMLFTADLLPDGTVLCAGGAPDLLGSLPWEMAEIFDPELRQFDPVPVKMSKPRFRHTSTNLCDGSILLTGGQVQATVTIIVICPICMGLPVTVTVFPSTPLSEIYSPSSKTFTDLTIPDTDQPSRLQTPRGRAGHAMGRLAGPDNRLETCDDMFLVAGGFQTLTGQFTPIHKLPGVVGAGRADGLTSLEFYDPQARIFTPVGNVSLFSPRINTPYIVNLGEFNEMTPDGVLGMGNLVLITHGSTDQLCPETPLVDELLMASYTGFGPAQGLTLFSIEDPENFGHSQGVEYAHQEADPRGFVGRSGTNPVSLRRRARIPPDVDYVGTWVLSLAGADISILDRSCRENSCSPTVRAGCAFDPCFSLVAARMGLSARDLSSQRSKLNVLGIQGTWLTLDGDLPTVDLSAFGSTAVERWLKSLAARRVWGKNLAIPGERILLTGGGETYGVNAIDMGGQPTTPSAEIFVPPKS